MRIFLLAGLLSACLLPACSRARPLPDLADYGPAFDPITFFSGHVRSWGVMEDRSGAPTGWVVTDCQGHRDGPDRLRMSQHLTFQDAPPQDRTWTLWRTGPHAFEATANNMLGSAKAETNGRALHWQWVLAATPGERPFAVTMDQWMYQLDDGSVMIRSTISKLGVILTEVSEQFRSVQAG